LKVRTRESAPSGRKSSTWASGCVWRTDRLVCYQSFAIARPAPAGSSLSKTWNLEPDERWRRIDNKPVGPSAIHNPTPMSAWGRGKVNSTRRCGLSSSYFQTESSLTVRTSDQLYRPARRMISSMSSKGSSRLEPDERWRRIDNKPVGPSAIHTLEFLLSNGVLADCTDIRSTLPTCAKDP
jgi:hypothetical protein